MTTPDDPWKDNFQGALGINWNEVEPSGLNWWAETIQIASAWDYNERFNQIKIAVLDGGFDINHEDLDISVINQEQNSVDKNSKDHGTHVAGIIGATANNKIGITGIVWNKELYGIDIVATEEQNKSQYIQVLDKFQGIYEAIRHGCKIINLSIGASTPISEADIMNEGTKAAAYLLHWKELFGRDDFLIVQSAGNSEANSITTGTFCSITDETIEKMFAQQSKYIQEKYSKEDIYKHIIIVGAIQKSENEYEIVNYYKISDGNMFDRDTWKTRYCYGNYISVVAPGRDIFSTVYSDGLNGSYGKKSGTSMAAPIVTGVASLVWSVNENFSAGEVKDIVCNYYNKTANGYADGDTRNYPIVNAKLAVEEAIRRTDKAGTISGFVKDSVTDKAIEGVQVSAEVGNAKRSALTDANGNFKIELPEDEYELIFEYNGYITKKVTAISEKNVSTMLLNTVYLTPITNLMGYVIEKETDKPIEGASIWLQQIDEGGMIVGEITCSTDANGQFSVNIPVGTYTYTINKFNMFDELYETATGSVTVEKADGNILGTVYLHSKRIIIELKDYLGKNIETETSKIDGMEKVDVSYGSQYENDNLTFCSEPFSSIISYVRIDETCNYSIFNICIGDDFKTECDKLQEDNWQIVDNGKDESGIIENVYLKKDEFEIRIYAKNNIVTSISCWKLIDYITDNTSLTVEQAENVLKKAHEIVVKWLGGAGYNPSQTIKVGQYDYGLVPYTHVEMKAEICSVLHHYYYEDLFEAFYTEQNGKLYYKIGGFGIEGLYSCTAGNLKMSNSDALFTMHTVYYDALGGTQQDEQAKEIQFEFVREDGKWVIKEINGEYLESNYWLFPSLRFIENDNLILPTNGMTSPQEALLDSFGSEDGMSVNMRTGPGTNNSIIKKIPDNSRVYVCGTSEAYPDWVFICYLGDFGWTIKSCIFY